MSLFVFNNQQKLIKSIPNRDLISVVQDQAINVSDTLFVEMPADIWGNLSEPASYLAVQDPYERFIYHMYKVSKHTTKADTTDIEAIQIGYDELKAYGYIKDRRFSNRPVLEAATAVVNGTDWQLGYVDTDLPNVNTNFYYISRLEALSKLIEATGAEVRFRVEISGNKIIAKRLDLYKQLGTFKGKRFSYGSNLLEIIKEEDTSELHTALVGRGKGEETDTSGFGRRITFTDIAWSKANGKPVDKPLGQEFIELPEMTAYYGYPDGEPRTGIVEFGDIEEPEQLLKATYERLVEISRPQVQFKAKVQTVGDMQLGEEVAIIRSDLGFRYKTRVFRVKRDYLNNMFTEVELGDKLTETLASRIKKIDTTNARREETIIQYIQTAANGKNKIFRGVLEPTEGMMVNDLWYKPVGEGETEMYQWNGAIWELILSTLDTTKVQQEVDAAIEQADADRAKAEVDTEQALVDAKAHADGEIERINTELSTDIDGAIDLAGQAKQDAIDKANQALVDAKAHAIAQDTLLKQAIGLEVDGAIEIAEQAKQDAIDKANQAYDDAVAEADRLAASRDDKITINAGQITAGVIDAARLDAVSIVTKGLTANVIKSTHIETSTATIEKLFADDATVNSLTSKTAFINSIKAVEIDASKITSGTINTARLNAKLIVTDGLEVDVIEAEHIKADTALIDKLFADEANINTLTSKTAFINSIKAVEIDASKITSGTINTARLNAKEIITEGLVANVIKSTHIQADTALFDKLFTSTLATDRLSAQTAWIKNGMFANASIDGAKIQDATIGSAKIVNLDASKVTANTLSAITTNTGALNVSGDLTMTTDNTFIKGTFNYGDTYTGAHNPRYFANGKMMIGRQNIQYEASVHAVNPDNSMGAWKYFGNAYFGPDTVKLRNLKSPNGAVNATTSIYGGEIVVASDYQGIDNGVTITSAAGGRITALGGATIGAGIEPSIYSNSFQINSAYRNNIAKLHLSNGPQGASFNWANKQGFADLFVGKDSYPVIWSNSVYGRAYSQSANMVINTDGSFGRASSASRYKLNISEIENLDQLAYNLLTVEPKRWNDKRETEAIAHEMNTGEDKVRDSLHLRQYHGLIAEDLRAAGLDAYISYNNKTGTIDGIEYDRLWTLLLPIIKKHQEDILELQLKMGVA